MTPNYSSVESTTYSKRPPHSVRSGEFGDLSSPHGVNNRKGLFGDLDSGMEMVYNTTNLNGEPMSDYKYNIEAGGSNYTLTSFRERKDRIVEVITEGGEVIGEWLGQHPRDLKHCVSHVIREHSGEDIDRKQVERQVAAFADSIKRRRDPALAHKVRQWKMHIRGC